MARWRHLQDKDPNLSSPFFSPEFAQAVGSARQDTFVAVVERGASTVGFFPFHRQGRVGKPIGGPICDYQGLILERGVALSGHDLLNGCGLDVIDFNHVPAVQPLFRQNSFITMGSPYMDLEAGYAAYVARRKKNRVREIDSTLRKSRKLEREVGPIRFVADDSEEAWCRLVEWKNAQYRLSNLVEVLGQAWVAATLGAIRTQKSESFAGQLSSLYAGKDLLAVVFVLRSRRVWHYWFPAYDVAFRRYSAGLILLLKLAEHGAATGIKTIDLGRGQARYKSAFADGEIKLCEGSIERAASPSGALRRLRKRVEPAWAAMPVGSARTLSRRLFNRLLWRF